jgi:ADP-dependent NAD(P)H-hydrate dehydratase / NAD(P)H-hydrate epimerase
MSGLYSVSQVRQLEHMALQQGLTELDLVGRAAKSVFDHIKLQWPDLASAQILLGKGGNAADGLFLSKLLHEAGIAVTLDAVFPDADLSPLAASVLAIAEEEGLVLRSFDPNRPVEGALLVDALLGIGVSGPLTEPVLAAVTYLSAADVPVLALDVPTGLNADTGELLGATVHAHSTVTFIAPKKGLYTGKAVTCCGDIVLSDLDLPAANLRNMSPAVDVLDHAYLSSCLPQRSRSANKGDFGHVLVIGGDYGMGGAIRLAAEAALRVGAGLVTVATRPEHVNIVSGSRPELMCHQVQQASDLDRMLNRATVIVLGPGLGKSDWAQAIFERILEAPQPKVMDADALNLLAQFPQQCDDWILTPHPGEACRLLDVPCSDVQNNRYDALGSLQDRYGGVVLLKGSGTLICSPDHDITLCPAGNPGMASGGMGDILSGMIGGLLAQKLSLLQAANAGVLAHARAADEAVIAGGGERGLLATDLLAHVRGLVNPSVL